MTPHFTVRLWRLQTNRCFVTLFTLLAAVWNLEGTGKSETIIPGPDQTAVGRVAFSPDGQHLAIAPLTAFQPFELQEVSSGKQVLAIQPKWQLLEAYCFRSVSFSSDGKWLALGGTDGRVRVWDLAAKKQVREYPAYGDKVPEQDEAAGYPDVTSLAISPDSRWIASAADRWVQVREVTSGKLLHEFTPAYFVAFSPDGKGLACAHGHTVRVWSMSDGRELQSFRFPGRSEATSLAFSPGGTKLAVAWRSGLGSVIDVSSGEEAFSLRSLHGQHEGVGRVAFSPDGKIIAAQSGAKHIVLWSVPEKIAFRVLNGHSGRISDFSFSPDGKHLASAGEYRTVFIWSIPAGEVVRKIQFPVPEPPGPINREDYFFDKEGKLRRRPGK